MKCIFCGEGMDVMVGAASKVWCSYCGSRGPTRKTLDQAQSEWASILRKVELHGELVTALSEVLPLMDDWKYPNGIMDKIKRGRDVLRKAREEGKI